MFHLISQFIICMVVFHRMLLRKVRRCLSMFLQKLLLMKLRKLVRLLYLILHEQQKKVFVNFNIQSGQAFILSNTNNYTKNENASVFMVCTTLRS